MCLFFTKVSGRLHNFSSLQSDTSVRSMAKNFQDAFLLVKIEGGDLAHLLIVTGGTSEIFTLVLLRNRLKKKTEARAVRAPIDYLARGIALSTCPNLTS